MKIGNFNAYYAWTLFTYDPKTGELRNKIDRPSASGEGAKKGELAGSYNNYGYLTVWINGKHYQAHQIIWLMMTGEWPERGIDHMNREKADNPWNNLRLATHSQQGRNNLRVDNTSGTTGVYWSNTYRRWIVQGNVDGKNQRYGSYRTKEEAVQVKEELDFIDLRRGWTWHGLWFWRD
jgi:hypothetical protein